MLLRDAAWSEICWVQSNLRKIKMSTKIENRKVVQKSSCLKVFKLWNNYLVSLFVPVTIFWTATIIRGIWTGYVYEWTGWNFASRHFLRKRKQVFVRSTFLFLPSVAFEVEAFETHFMTLQQQLFYNYKITARPYEVVFAFKTSHMWWTTITMHATK